MGAPADMGAADAAIEEERDMEQPPMRADAATTNGTRTRTKESQCPRQGRAELSPEWRAWIVENLLRGADNEEIVKALDAGVPAP